MTLIGLIRDVAHDSILHDYFDAFDDVCRGARRIPTLNPGEEIHMTPLSHFALGTAVVLITSLETIKRSEEADRKFKEAQKHAGNAVFVHSASFDQPVEAGTVIGVAHFTHRRDEYLVRYRAADGRQVDEWFAADAIARDPRVEVTNMATDEEGNFRIHGHIAHASAKEAPSPAPEPDEQDEPAEPTREGEWHGTVIKVYRYAADGGITGMIEIPLI